MFLFSVEDVQCRDQNVLYIQLLTNELVSLSVLNLIVKFIILCRFPFNPS